MAPLSDLLPERHRRRKQRERDEALRPSSITDPFPALDGTLDPADYFRSQNVFQHGWYGIGRGDPLPVCDCIPDGDWTILEFWSDAGCRVRTGEAVLDAAELVTTWPGQVLSALVSLRDGRLSATLLDPLRSFFRRPDEAGFWGRIVTDGFDATARQVYADWLDDHDDPHAWVFREPRPFRLDSHPLDWTGAMGRVDCGAPERRTLREFARITNRGSAVPFTLSDGTPVPQFVAYLLGVTRIRADLRIPDADRGRLRDLTGTLGMSVVADLIVGTDAAPVCRVSDSLRTIDLLDGLAGRADSVTPEELVARLREVNPPATETVEEDAHGPHLRLVGMNDEVRDREWSYSTPFVVGRASGGLVIDGSAGDSVSRRHAALSHDEAGWWVTDLGSTNGTYLNGVRQSEEPGGPLRAGDVLQFGAIAFRVEIADWCQ